MKHSIILKEIKNCLYCKKEFVAKRDTQKYCSPIHRKLDWKKNHRKQENTWQRKRKFWREWYAKNKKVDIKPRKCLICHLEFVPDWRHNFQKYCSNKCRWKVQRRKYRKKHLQKIKEKDAEYKAKTRFGFTSKTLNRKIVDNRDKRICRLCGTNKQIVIHHIKYSGKAKDLVSLCRACHANIHQKIKNEPYWEY